MSQPSLHSKEETNSQRDPDDIPSTQEYIEPRNDSQKTPSQQEIVFSNKVRPTLLPPLPTGLDSYMLSFVASNNPNDVEANNTDYPRQLFVLLRVSTSFRDYYVPLLQEFRLNLFRDLINFYGGRPVRIHDLFDLYRVNTHFWIPDDSHQFAIYLEKIQGLIIRNEHVHHEEGKHSSCMSASRESALGSMSPLYASSIFGGVRR
jgi:hypothetical protein